MPNVRTILQSFGAGEMSPEMFGRITDAKYQQGAAKMRNFVAQPQGPARRRSGLEFVREVKDSDSLTRLLPFTYSTDQTFAIEAGSEERDTGTSTAVTSTTLSDSTQSWSVDDFLGDWVYSAGSVGKISANTATQLTVFDWTPSAPPAGSSYTIYRGAFRFHTKAATLLWAKSEAVSAVDTAADTIAFATDHGFSSNDAVRVIAFDNGTEPGGLDDLNTFHVIIVDRRTIKLSATPGPGAPVNLTSTGSGDLRVLLAADVPARYVPSQTVSVIDDPNDELDFASAHLLSADDPITFTGSDPPDEIVVGETYYAIIVSSTTIQVAATPGGAAMTLTNGTAANTRMHRDYVIGDLVYWNGTANGVSYCKIARPLDNALPAATNHWQREPNDGVYEVPHPYAPQHIMDVHYAQSNDVLTLVHTSYRPRELSRLGATNWTMETIAFGSQLTAPTGFSASIGSNGERMKVSSVAGSPPGPIATQDPANFDTPAEHAFTTGDVVYLSGAPAAAEIWIDIDGGQITDGYYIVHRVTANQLRLNRVDGQDDFAATNGTGTGYLGGIRLMFVPLNTDLDHKYKVTAVAEDGSESEPTAEQTVTGNNLNNNGARNNLSWNAVAGAERYRVYKEQTGLFGLIGETDETSFEDDNISPDLDRAPPIADSSLSGTDFPGAVGYFEQRRAFGGTRLFPQGVWMTRTGTESDLTFTLPVKDDNRLQFQVSAREASTIRHIMPLDQLLLLSSSAEYRVSPINDDALTPTSVTVRPQSYVGASQVQPQVVNNNLVYCAARGGHVRELGFLVSRQGFVTGDLSLRAAHLFDGLAVLDMAYGKAPHPVLWFVSSSGKLLGLTYVPEESIGAWHQHDTDGTFESCAVVSEGDEDVLYVVVQRTINGASKRYVERLREVEFTALENAFFVDAGGVFDGANTSSTTMTVTGGAGWGPGEALTLTASKTAFLTSDQGDVVVLTAADGSKYRLTIVTVTSDTAAVVTTDERLAADLQATATTAWAWARAAISGLEHLEGETVQILADGALLASQTVSSGAITLATPAALVHVGLAFTSELQTLPQTIPQVEAGGHGRTRNINAAWLRLFESAGGELGPTAALTVPTGLSKTALQEQEVRIVLTPDWSDGGQVLVRQTDPLPLTVVALVKQVAIGG